MGDVTAFAELTKAWRAGELAARDRLVALVYDLGVAQK